MEKDIAEGQIGTFGKYDVEFKGGFLVAKFEAKAEFGVSSMMEVKIEADALIDSIAKAIPGQVDDAVFAVLKAALKV
jgi:hypothetical protein